ncbi:GTP cyclohydrolase, partial [Enterococcus faecium]
FDYSIQFPAQVYGFDDGTRESILLPCEIRNY